MANEQRECHVHEHSAHTAHNCSVNKVLKLLIDPFISDTRTFISTNDRNDNVSTVLKELMSRSQLVHAAHCPVEELSLYILLKVYMK